MGMEGEGMKLTENMKLSGSGSVMRYQCEMTDLRMIKQTEISHFRNGRDIFHKTKVEILIWSGSVI